MCCKAWQSVKLFAQKRLWKCTSDGNGFGAISGSRYRRPIGGGTPTLPCSDASSTLQRRHYLIWREPVPEQRQRAWRSAPIVSGPLLPPQVELPDAKTAAYGLRLLCSWLSA